MTTRSYRATRTQSNGRPGWSVTFGHPLRTDARGKSGKKMRRGLGTTENEEAQRLVGQLNELFRTDPGGVLTVAATPFGNSTAESLRRSSTKWKSARSTPDNCGRK